METILHGDCHHLECCDIQSEYCLKRYFTFFDFRTFQEIRYGFCNDYLRLLINQRVIQQKQANVWAYHSNELEEFLFDFAKHEFDYKPKSWSFNMPGESMVNVLICQRPRIYASFELKEATLLLVNSLDNGNSFGQRLSDNLQKMFFESYMNCVKTELERLLKYKKYKSQHAKCEAIIKRFERNGIDPRNNGTLDLLQLINEFFNLKINMYETNEQ